MSEYCLNIKENIELGAFSLIDDYVALIDYEDRLTITITENDDRSIELVCSMLQNKNFNILSKTIGNEGECHIVTCRNRIC